MSTTTRQPATGQTITWHLVKSTTFLVCRTLYVFSTSILYVLGLSMLYRLIPWHWVAWLLIVLVVSALWVWPKTRAYGPGLWDWNRFRQRRALTRGEEVVVDLLGLVPVRADGKPWGAFYWKNQDVSLLYVPRECNVSSAAVESAAETYAPNLSAIRVKVRPGREPGSWLVDFVHRDPLAGARDVLDQSTHEARFGRLADGSDAVVDITDASHIIIQGQTRSGKSVASEVLLSQWSGTPDVEVWGVDPHKVLLKPFAENPDAEAASRIVVSKDGQAIVDMLDRYIEVCEQRITEMSEQGLDKLEDFSKYPIMLLVIEEAPAIVENLTDQDKTSGAKPAERLLPKFTGKVGTIFSEFAKVGARVLFITQRADTEVISGRSRGQAGTRITMGVDNGDAVKMLHPQASPELQDRVTGFDNGRCLMWQHRHQQECQADYLSHSTYRERVLRNLARTSAGRSPASRA